MTMVWGRSFSSLWTASWSSSHFYCMVTAGLCRPLDRHLLRKDCNFWNIIHSCWLPFTWMIQISISATCAPPLPNSPSVLLTSHCLFNTVCGHFWTLYMLDTSQVEPKALAFVCHLASSFTEMLQYYSHFMLNEAQVRSYYNNNFQKSSRHICLNT